MKHRSWIRLIYFSVLSGFLITSYVNCGIQKPGVDNRSSTVVANSVQNAFGVPYIVESQNPTYFQLNNPSQLGNGTAPVVSVAPFRMSLPMMMNHNTSQVSPDALKNCNVCHNEAASGSYVGGIFHKSLTTANIPQPFSCIECHQSSWVANPTGTNNLGPTSAAPIGMVGTSYKSSYLTLSNNSVSRMMHDGLIWGPNAGVPTRGTSPVFDPIKNDCNLCHVITPTNPTWQGGKYHSALAGAGILQAASCLDCHISDRPLQLTAGVYGSQNVGPLPSLPLGSKIKTTFDHFGKIDQLVFDPSTNQSTPAIGLQVGMRGCQECHNLNQSAGAINTWKNGLFHKGINTATGYTNSHGTFGPGGTSNSADATTKSVLRNCSSCHESERPVTWSPLDPAHVGSPFATDHAKTYLGAAGNDCVVCHNPPNPPDAIVKPAGDVDGTQIDSLSTNWKFTSFHGKFSNIAKTPGALPPRNDINTYGTCIECHDSQRKNLCFFMNTSTGALQADASGNPVPANDCTVAIPSGPYVKINHGTDLPYSGLTSSTAATNNGNDCTNCHLGVMGKNFAARSDWYPGLAMGSAGFVTKTVSMDNATTVSVKFLMNHGATVLNNYPSLKDPATGALSCISCHVSTNPTISPSSTFKVGSFHFALNTLGLAQPTNNCTQCHSNDVPIGRTLNGMDHTATLVRTLDGVQSAAKAIDCAYCHFPLITATLHTPSSPAAVPQAFKLAAGKTLHTLLGTDYKPLACSNCHKHDSTTVNLRRNNLAYKGETPLPPALGSQKFVHNLLPANDCSVCHKGGTFIKASPSASSASWTKEGTTATVAFHANFSITVSCNTCHVAPLNVVVSDGAASKTHTLTDTACESCHKPTVLKVSAKPTALAATDWAGGAGVPDTYTLNAFTAATGATIANASVPGFTGTHTKTNTNCSACHGADSTFKTIGTWDHQGLPTTATTCNSCHLPPGASPVAQGGVIQATFDSRHHKNTLFFNKTTGQMTGLTCIGCHTEKRGATTFTSTGGVNIPTTAQQSFVNIGCGSVSATTFSCHNGGQRQLTIPRTPGAAGSFSPSAAP